MRTYPVEESSTYVPAVPRRILVVGHRGFFPEHLITHSVQLAGRLKYDLLALSVDTRWTGEPADPRAPESLKSLAAQCDSSGVRCDHTLRVGDVGIVVEEVIHETKRIEMVLMDFESGGESLEEISVPVVGVLSDTTKNRKGNTMSAETDHKHSRRDLIVKTSVAGLLSAGLYAAVFTNADTVMHYLTKGGWYAALPIATVFVFSFAHGYFAHHLWSLLGIEAYRKDRVTQTQREVIARRPQLRKRPRLHAYVNPFHRIYKS